MDVTNEVVNAFNAHALEYEQAAKVQYEIGERLFERLSYLKINPRYVLDLGCGPGYFLKKLKRYYPKAEIIGVDLVSQMLQLAQAKKSWRHKWSLVQANMTVLPFAEGLFDLVFANQVIHWAVPMASVISELNRVMSPQGCLMFSTLGPDTFRELRQAFQSADKFAHVNEFADMHDIGDCLQQEYFLDPVVDMEWLTLHYPSLKGLLDSLRAQGVRNINPNRNRGLTGKQSWLAFKQAMLAQKTLQDKVPLTYEVIYGHAWKGNQRRTANGVETFISVDKILKK